MSRERRGDGTLYQRGNVWWVQYSIRGEVYRESTHSDDHPKAVKLLRRRLGEASRGKVIGPVAEKVTLKDLTEGLLTDYRLRGHRSVSTATLFTKNLLEHFGETAKAIDIGADRVAAFAEKRQRDGLSNASINRETACLRHAFNLAVQAGRLSRDHVPAVPRLKEAEPRAGFVEPAEFAKLRDALPRYLRGLAEFAYLTGWRKGAVRSLAWTRDTELELCEKGKTVVGGAIKLQAEHSKNKKPYVLRLKGELLEVIKRAWDDRVDECPFIFHFDGEQIGDFRKAWKTACTAAGLNGLLVHDFRRSAARNLVRAGVPERVAMDVTGHSTRSMFDRYSISSTADIESAIEKVSVYVTTRATEKPKIVPIKPKQKAA